MTSRGEEAKPPSTSKKFNKYDVIGLIFSLKNPKNSDNSKTTLPRVVKQGSSDEDLKFNQSNTTFRVIFGTYFSEFFP